MPTRSTNRAEDRTGSTGKGISQALDETYWRKHAVVTTSANGALRQEGRARHIAKQYHLRFVARTKRPLALFLKDEGVDTAIVIGDDPRVALFDGVSPHGFFYHPGISLPRVKAMEKGEMDRFVELCGVRRGDHVWDGTAGLCSEATLLAAAVGEEGQVTATEAHFLTYLVVREGLAAYHSSSPQFNSAIRRIALRFGVWQEQVRMDATKRPDIFYLDPMFEQTINRSSGMQALKPYTLPACFSRADLDLARGFARRRLIVKTRRHSAWLRAVQPDELHESARIAYAVFYAAPSQEGGSI
ncbi:class I SAM-dependent methyltransferase [Ferroacidibacillus organovorans]|uniref:class I SAM-dependent methyltransferase n=1 Tax=Ferroacidibacillus organovorans TaxID=1765683 RepID=UPI0012E7E8B0|nr:class I SAM-dependent methyltransferase [Ferroacidibacillus organovorans]